jgi:hypothetical protein
MATRAARPVKPHAPAATHVVRFEQPPEPGSGKEQVAPGKRVPRVARLLVLGYRIDGMIRSGEIHDWAEAARLTGVTRARMTQVANLLLLAPKIQESILSLSNVIYGEDSITEHTLRDVVAHADWQSQELTCPRPER